MRSRKPGLGFILVTIALDVLGFGLLIPVGPKLVESLLHGGLGGTEAEAAPKVALLMTTWYTMSFLLAPTLGCLSDHFGRRRVLLVSLLGSGIDFFAQALSPTLTWLFITRAINGLSGASLTVANAYIADVTPPQKRAAAYGMVGAAFGLGFVIGPLLGGVLGGVNIRLPFFVAGGLTLLNWLYGLWVLPESLPEDRRRRFSLARANPVGALHAVGRYPLVTGLAIAMFMLNMAQFALHATWVLYTGHRYGWESEKVGLSLFAVGIGAAVVQGGLARKIIPALGERRSLMLGLALGVLSYIGYGMATEGWMIFVVIAIGSLGGISQPAGQALITRAVRPDEQGEIQGALTSLQSIAGILGPPVGGTVLGYAIGGHAAFNMPGASFFVSAGLAGIGWIIAGWAVRRGGGEGAEEAVGAAAAE
ncbi:MAG: TCR/Tet family MFS transporter [Phycisphaeraceae bacterium]|nr:TCR/Tet family MFS transporter [Phycisphaeraceae bacterium]